MNLFYLDKSPELAAQMQCNKHIPKMVVETAQMLSTAHRVIDGMQTVRKSAAGRNLKYWILDDFREQLLYKPTHVNHPSAVWIRQSEANYMWAVRHLQALLNEFRLRFGKRHKTSDLYDALNTRPERIRLGELTPIPLAMGSNPECIDNNDPVGSYRKYYQTKQERFKMIWTVRNKPEWFEVK